MTRRGMVWLVGAGPGDPQLMTVRGLNALRQAQVVVYDHLVSERLLEECPPAARRIYVGKEHGRHAMRQEAITRLLVREGRAGRAVVRLKGGDPLLFGRGGEEALALTRARVPFAIVPGVTSALAVPAYAGIPVTHRDLSSSVAIVTGHEDPSKSETAVRWDRLAGAVDTIVCLMGVGTLRATVERLITHGRVRSTPCAVIEWGTFPRQRTVTATLGTIVKRCATATIRPPASIVVGDVVALRPKMNWFESRPLFGRRILVTRAEDRAGALIGLLEERGAEAIALPAIELAPVRDLRLFREAVRELDEMDWVFFTSPEGLDWFRRLLARLRQDLRILRGRHIAAIGPKTAASIRAMGIHVDVVPTSFRQEGLLQAFGRRRLAGTRGLIFCAAGSRDVLEQGLQAKGMTVRRIPIYETVVPPLLIRKVRALWADSEARPTGSEPYDLVTVTSASCVEHLVQAMRAAGLADRVAHVPFASIGPVTSQAVTRHGGGVVVEAKTSTVEGLVDAITAAARPRRRAAAVRQHGG